MSVSKILEKLNGIDQYRKEQYKLFQEKQMLTFPKHVEKSTMPTSEKLQDMDQHKENLDVSELQTIENSQISFNSNTTVDSSVTGHMLRCFDDSTDTSPIISNTNTKKSLEKPDDEVSNIGKLPPAKFTKFLRKKTGLNRYYKSKSDEQDKVPNDNSTQKQDIPPPQSKLDRNPTETLSKFVSSQRNTKNFSQKDYVQFIGQKPANLNKDTCSVIHAPEQLRECHPTVEYQTNLNKIEKNKTSCNNEKLNPSTSNVDSNINHGVQSEESVKEQISVPLKTVSAIPENGVENAELNHVIGNINDCDNLNLSKDSLAEFEILEEHAQNCSFNSDSSVVQRALRGEMLIPNKSDKTEIKKHSNTASYSTESPFHNLNFSKIRSNLLAQRQQQNKDANNEIESVVAGRKVENYVIKRKQMESNEIQEKKIESINSIMSDNKLRLDDLQKKITSENEVFLENENFVNERCSTPVNTTPELAIPLCSDSDANVASNYLKANDNKLRKNYEDQNVKSKVASDDLLRDSFHLIENEHALCDKLGVSNLQQTEIKEKMKQKIDQLQKEIEIYQEHNAQLEKVCKERNEVSRKLKKEYDGIEKYKAEQMKSIEKEVEKERQQIKRERENFQRLKKMQKENFTRQEREELSTLRKENEKLQEQLKRQRIKFTSDINRMKSQLVAAENERDESKLKIISLEEQVDELLNVLRTRCSKTKTSKFIASNKEDPIEKSQQNSDDSSIVDCNKSNQKKDSTVRKMSTVKKSHSNKFVKVNSSKPRVRFNLTPQFETSKEDTSPEESRSSLADQSSIESDHGFNDEHENDTDINENTAEVNDYPEVENSNIQNDSAKPIVSLLPSGDQEILYPSGTKKIIGVDGIISIVYADKNIKHIYPNNCTVFIFNNGVVEESKPDGSKMTTYPSGQIEYLMPNGERRIHFPDGDSQIIYPDGTETYQKADGRKRIMKPDGTEVIYSAKGDKEIRTSDRKTREFADGSVRIVHSDGKRETRFPSGRIRIKDKDGRIIMDTKIRARKHAW